MTTKQKLVLAMTAMQTLACGAAEPEGEEIGTSSAAIVEVFRQEAEHGPWDQGYPKVLGQGYALIHRL